MKTKIQWNSLFKRLKELKESLDSKIDKVLDEKDKLISLEDEDDCAYYCLEEAFSIIWEAMCDNIPSAIEWVDKDWYDKWVEGGFK